MKMKNKRLEQLKKELDSFGVVYQIIKHPPIKTVEEGLEFLGIGPEDGVSTLVFKADGKFIVVFRRDDHKLDLGKIKKFLKVSNLQMATPDEILSNTGGPIGATPMISGLYSLMDETILKREFVYGGTGSFEHDLKISSHILQKVTNAITGDFIETGTKQRVKKRILTGDTPTGKLHLGHYVGALENRIKLQHEYDTYIILANVHAYASNYQNPDIINESVYNVFLDNLAVGLDPNVATIFLESGVPEIYEFYAQFLTMVKHSRIIRNPTIKEEIKYKKLDPSVGFIMYPILQAADILAFNADLVPVGEDQLPVLEQTREIAREFNKTYGDTFVVPEAKMGRVARLVGTDGTMKMSKSGGNAILLSEDKETLKKKVMSIYTDPNRIHLTDPGKVEGNPVFMYHDCFNSNKEEVEDLKERYLKGKVGDIEVKEKLFIALDNFLTPIREKRKYYEDRPKEAKEILMEGTKRARKTAQEVLEKFREKTKLVDLIK